LPSPNAAKEEKESEARVCLSHRPDFGVNVVSLIAKSTIQEVNDRLDAVAVVEEYVRLEKKGGRWWGLCPFHHEKTPSFTVNPELKTYHCFGCGKGGGIIGFVMEMDKIGYPEAVKILAHKLGIEVVYEDGGSAEIDRDWAAENARKEELFELYRRTAVTFQHFLLKKTEGRLAYEYIISRGISEAMIERFRLGFAPADRFFLYRFLTQKGYSEEFLDKSGLFSTRHKGMSLFSNRLMFPIADRQGRTVAFSGRVMPGAVQNDGREPPKYINTPELETYKKGQTLFAVDLAIPVMRQTKTVYIAEGNLDVIALHQAGLTNAVAPLGTAFTDDQAKLLGRWAEKAVLVFDSDEAGQNAALKGIITCRKNGLSCAVVRSGETGGAGLKDPADILQKFGAETLKKSMECSINDFEYLISRGRSLFNVSIPEGKRRALSLLFPWLEALDSEVERDDCVASAADAFGVERDAVWEDYNRHRAGGRSAREEVSSARAAGPGDRPIHISDELRLLVTVSINPDLYTEFRKALEIREIEDPAAKELFVALEECFVREEHGIDSLLSRIGSESLRRFIVQKTASDEFKRNPKRLMDDGIRRLKLKRFRRRSEEIPRELRNRERNGTAIGNSGGGLEDLLAEKMFVDAEIRKLEGK
jgi:DNA primase